MAVGGRGPRDRRVIVGDRRLVIEEAAVEGGAVQIIIRLVRIVVDCLLIGGEQRGEALFLAGAGDFLDARGIARGRTNAKFALLERRRLRARGGPGAGGQCDALGAHAFDIRDRKSVVKGKSVSVRVDTRGTSVRKKKKNK